MKANYKQKLFFYIFLIFIIFTTGIIIFEQSREKKQKTEALKETLDVYASVTDLALTQHASQFNFLDSLITLFPQDIRLTLIDKQGIVLYDNSIRDISKLENHAERPEIKNAKKTGSGSFIRISSSNHREYLYYAKNFPNYFVRVALPYNVRVKHFLEPDNLFIYFIGALFISMLFFIHYVADRFSKSIKQLRDFTLIAKKNNAVPAGFKFPDDELGEVGFGIAESYQQLARQKKEISMEREKLLQHVYSSEEGLCFFSADNQIEFYNGLFIQYLNIIIDEPNSEPRSIFTDPAFDKVSTFLTSTRNKNDYFETQISKQGKHFNVRVNIFDDNSFEITLNDITEEEKTRLLKQEITSNIAHELRTPVTSIRGYLETILEQSPDEDKKQYFIEKAYRQVILLSELIQDMSLITKIEEAPQSFSTESINIRTLLESIQTDLEIALQEKEIQLIYNIENNILVKGNRHLLYSVFRNLTDNVIRHAGNQVTISINRYKEDKDFHYFSYSDNGPGISNEQHLKRLFERFYRVNEGRTRDTGGSGLGLSIVKNAILFHKGTIDVKNKPGGGLEFLFKLPKAISH